MSAMLAAEAPWYALLRPGDEGGNDKGSFRGERVISLVTDSLEADSN